MKIIKKACLLALMLTSACAKPENVTDKNPTSVPERKIIQPTPQCEFMFTKQMTPKEVAITALKIKEVCKLSESNIENLAAKF